MSVWFWVLMLVFIVVSTAMVLIILVQRPQGGGLAGAFGGAGGASTETVFGGRVGDALTWATVIGFTIWLAMAIGLNLLDNSSSAGPAAAVAGATTQPASESAPDPDSPGDEGEP